MIEADVVMIEIVGNSLPPRITGRVEAVAKTKVIGKRKHGQQLLDGSGGLRRLSIEILPENAEGLQASRRGRRAHRAALQIYRRNRCVGIAVLHSGKESKEPPTSRLRICG